jgi:hypothetical protein
MSVPEQIPYVGYLANGQSTEFPITFDLHDPEYLVVTLNKEIPAVGTYVIDMNALKVVFATAPKSGDQIELYRETTLNRDIDYKSYDNSFRPETVNYDYDKIWHVLQEQGMINAETLAKIKEEIEWRRTHDANFDELAKMRDAQVFAGLKSYIDTLYSASNPNIFDGVTAGIVFALDKKSVQTHLEIIYGMLESNRTDFESGITEEKERALIAESDLLQKIQDEALRALNAENEINNKVNALGGGVYGFNTYAEFDAAKSTIPNNSVVKIGEVNTGSGLWAQGDNIWDGTTLKKSPYDPLQQAKDFASTKFNALNKTLGEQNAQSPMVSTGTDSEFLIQDKNGVAGFGVMSDGSVLLNRVVPTVDILEIESGLNLNNNVSFENFENKDYKYAITDNAYNVSFGIRTNGLVEINGNVAQTLYRSALDPLSLPFKKTAICCGFDYGQSLARGVNATPVLSTVQNFANLMLKSGVLRRSSDPAFDGSAFVPLIAQAISNEGEAPGINTVNELTKYMVKKGISPQNSLFTTFASGVAGYRIDQLVKGTAPYNDTLARITAEKNLADAQGWPYSVGFINWTGGEANMMNNTTLPSYISQHNALFTDLIADIKTITGQAFDPIVVQYQSAAQWRQTGTVRPGNIDVAKALFKLSQINPNVICATAMYQMTYGADNLHLTATSSQLLGAYYARALRLAFLEGKKFKPLHPTAVNWVGKNIDIEFFVPVGELTIDTTNVAAYENFGFLLRNVSDNSVVSGAITSVKVTGRNSVRVTLANDTYASTSYLISYAQGNGETPISPINGARGNLRDEAGEEETTEINGALVRLDNWCLIFDFTYGGEL